ncbi:PD40 domain-containing protein [bacterium]|nr:PD40 domain-containing protein [bacterium]
MFRFITAGLALLLVAATRPALAAEAFLQHPALSADGELVYFTAQGDIWVADTAGRAPARRLTDNIAHEDMPLPSPDGSLLAFRSFRHGNADLFVMPSAGGAATRLSFSTDGELPLAWYPDGQALLVTTRRQDPQAPCLYRIGIDGSQPERVAGPDHDSQLYACWAGGTDDIIYTRGPGDEQRKRHKGQDSFDLWRLQEGRHSPLVTTRGRDAWPACSPDGSVLYWTSDRSGCDNIWMMQLPDGEPRQMTDFSDDGPQFLRMSSGGDWLACSVFGSLWLMDTKSQAMRELHIELATEPKHEQLTSERWQDRASELAVSPNGNYFAIVLQGDIYLLKNPDAYEEQPDQDLSTARLLVGSPGRDWQLSWHHEGRSICYVSDRTGEYDIYMFDLATGEERQLTKTPEDEALPLWSPVDGRICYYRGNHELRVLDSEGDAADDILISRAEHRIGPFGGDARWSPDGAWLAYSYAPVAWSSDVFITASSGGEEHNVTLTPDSEYGPQWSGDGSYLGFSFSSRDDYSNEFGARARLLPLDRTEYLYDAELLFPEDRPEQEETEAGDEAAADDEAADAKGDEEEGDEVAEVLIDFDEIENRSETLPDWGGEAQLELLSPDGSVAILTMLSEGSQLAALDTFSGDFELLGKGRYSSLQFNEDGSRLYGLNSGAISYIDLKGSSVAGQGGYPAGAMLTTDVRVLRRQSFREMWRILRDNFYDPEMHGTDWEAVKRKYEPMLESVVTPEEYNQLMEHFVGELAASHSWFFSPGESGDGPYDGGGSLGIELDEDYSGPGWLVARVIRGTPAWEHGSELYPGDLIEAVNGEELSAASQRDRLLRNTEGELLRLQVRSGEAALAALREQAAEEADEDEEIAEPEATREVLIIPASPWEMYGPQYEQWVRDNRAVVTELSGGRVAYQHIEGMDFRSLARFRRELYSLHRDSEALIIDVRFNGGGDIYAQLYDILTSPLLFRTRTRFGETRSAPEWRWQGPVVVLINAWSYSDAEDFAHMMQEQQLATIVGEDTGGNVIAVSGVKLLDGSFFGLPLEGWYRLDGRNMEGFGCPADIFVEIDPNALAEGRDNQLEAAVATLLSQLGGKSAANLE